ncbi:MAG: zf-HC2 domain-containing protein [Actinomycetota bacterium]
MTCDDVRELLPEHLLGILAAEPDAVVERHLRGCGACRQELARLEDGLAALAQATHDEEPPPELRERVLAALRDEREHEERVAVVAPGRSRMRAFAIAAGVALLVALGSIAWGIGQAGRADRLVADANSYRGLLETLGGKDFYVGTVHPAGDEEVGGQILLYEGDRDGGWSSWGVLFVHAPGRDGEVTATLLSEDGHTLELPRVEFEEGEAASWIVVSEDLSGFDRLTITAADGSLLATATIAEA